MVVSDGKGNSDDHDVTISVTNVEEVGEVTISTLQPRVGVELTAGLTDPDGDITGLMWQWYRSTNIALNPDPAALTTTECELDDSNDCVIKDATSAAYIPTSGGRHRRNAHRGCHLQGWCRGGHAERSQCDRCCGHIADRRPKAPEFPDKDTETEGVQTDDERTGDRREHCRRGEHRAFRLLATDRQPW